MAAQIGPDHLSAWAHLAITLGSPTLGVISGAIVYTIIRRADRESEAEAQRGRRGIIDALKGDPQRVGGLFYREGTASIEIYRALPRQAVEKPGRPPGPRRPIHPARRNLRALPDPVEDDPSSLSQRTSAASGNICPVDDFAEATIAGVAVSPGDVAADHAGLLGVAGVVGAIHGEVAQRGELGFDAVQPGGIGGHIGQLDVVGRSPLADPWVVTGRQVRL